MKFLKLKWHVWAGLAAGAIILGVLVFFGLKKVNIGVINAISKKDPVVSSIAGLPCDNASRRPIAVMLESDPEGRPLSVTGPPRAGGGKAGSPHPTTRFFGG